MATLPLTPEQLEALKAIDTPTICNAIEPFNVRERVEGFMGMNIRSLTPEFGTMIGYAITVTVDSTTPDVPRSEEAWVAWLKAMEASPKPGILVFKDVGDNVLKSAHLGEVMATIATRLGVTGIVTDGGIRDIVELKGLGFHCFARGLAPSHGNPRLLEVNIPVEIDGMLIQPGDLLHGDANGVTTIPQSIADKVAAEAGRVYEVEGELMAYIKGPEFTVDGLAQRTT